jgi:hypothetical protein
MRDSSSLLADWDGMYKPFHVEVVLQVAVLFNFAHTEDRISRDDEAATRHALLPLVTFMCS